MFLAKCSVSLNNFGSYIFRKGEAVEALYFLIEGQVKIYKKVNEKAIELGTV
jgi:CRP-like cAMP-binding protein